MYTSHLVKQLKLSKIQDANSSISDIIIANDIWGADLAGLKGKSTAIKNKPIPIDVCGSTCQRQKAFVVCKLKLSYVTEVQLTISARRFRPQNILVS